jgi:hypothetical protein
LANKRADEGSAPPPHGKRTALEGGKTMAARNLKMTLWIGLAAGAITLVPPARAEDPTNVVPNPGFEQSGCGPSTPDICGWTLSPEQGAFMTQDTNNPHSGSASMNLGWSGETGGEFGGWGAEAVTDPAFSAAIGPGAHASSFWYRDAESTNGPAWVSLGADFYQSADCTGATLQASLAAPSQTSPGEWGQTAGALIEPRAAQGEWGQMAGALVAPPGTQSALFVLSVSGDCGTSAAVRSRRTSTTSRSTTRS